MQPEAVGGMSITASGGSIAAGTIMGDAILGTVVQIGGGAMPAPETVVAPPGLHNLPRPPAGVFAGRDPLLAQLADPAIRGFLLHGLGGAGKSELALHAAHRARARHSVVWWLNAESPETIDRGLADLTRRLHPVATLTDAREWAIGWLQTHPGWLLILDDVEEPRHIADLLGGLGGQGRMLGTTRRDLGRAVWSRFGLTTVPVGPLPRAASVRVLVGLAGRPAEADEAALLAADLGDLPLALTQAAAYVSQRDMSFAAYRRRLAAQPARMHAATAEGTDADRTIDRVWSITMEALRERPEADAVETVLAIMSALATEPLPEEIPVADQAREPGDAMAMEDAIALLASYSMIGRAGGRIWVHRLVQAVTHAHLDEQNRAASFDEAAVVLNLYLRGRAVEDAANWPRWSELLPHLEALHAHGDDLPEYARGMSGRLLALGASYLLIQGRSGRALEILEGLIPGRIRQYGEDHDSVTGLVNQLGLAYKAVGRYDDALARLEWALARTTEDDEHGLAIRNNLAAAYSELGRPADALPLAEAVAAGFERQLGADDPMTLRVRGNLAITLGEAGQSERAIPLAVDVAAANARRYGARDRRALMARSNASGELSRAGRHDEAIAILEVALPDLVAVVGDDHPDTQAARSVLAAALRGGGRVEEGLALEAAIYATRVRVHGPDDPLSLTSHLTYADGLLEFGRFDEAVAELRAVVAERERIFGPDHLFVGHPRASLEAALRAATSADTAVRGDDGAADGG